MARVEQQIKYHLRAIKMSQDQKNSPRTPKPKSLRGIEKQINQLTARISEGQINLRSSPTTPKMSKTLDQDIDLTLTKTPDEVSFYGTPMVLRSQCKQRVNPQMLEEMNRLKHLLKTEMEENQRKDEEIERLTATIQFLELKKTDEFKINTLEEEKKELLKKIQKLESEQVRVLPRPPPPSVPTSKMSSRKSLGPSQLYNRPTLASLNRQNFIKQQMMSKKGAQK